MNGMGSSQAKSANRRGPRWQRALRVALAAVMFLALPAAVPARERQPLDLGWQRHFTVTWDTTQRRGQTLVEGYVNNVSPYSLTNVRVLVDGLDGAGHVVSQRVGRVPGDVGGGGHLFFSVPVEPAAAYRVQIYSYDRVESAGLVS
jgi:hypothetical protein